MEYSFKLSQQIRNNIIKGMHDTLSDEQKQNFKIKFIQHLTNKYQFENCMPSEKVLQEQIDNVYTEENFSKIQYYLELGSIKRDNIGPISFLWFELFIEFMTEMAHMNSPNSSVKLVIN